MREDYKLNIQKYIMKKEYEFKKISDKHTP